MSDIFAFAVYDSTLKGQVARGLVPHFSADQLAIHEPFGPAPRPYQCGYDIPNESERLQATFKPATLAIIGCTGVNQHDFWAIEAARKLRVPCGIIVMTEDRAMWAAFSLLHSSNPFDFVVSVGSVRGDKFHKLFPNAPTVCDVSSLIEPGEQIARFIKRRGAFHS